MRHNIIGILTSIFLILPGFASPALAASPVDGSSNCLCAIMEVVECNLKGECSEVTPEEINVPSFIKIDFKKKSLGSLDETDPKVTEIKAFEKDDVHLILQGSENQRAWSMMVEIETGKMSASVSTDDYGFLLFGKCTNSH